MRCIRMPNIQNINAAGGRASISFPLGVTYEKIYFHLGTTGLTKAAISNIVLKLNNKEFQRWAYASDMELFNAYKGNNVTNPSILVFDFTERAARQEVGMKLGTVAACQEAGVQSFTLEFDVAPFTLTGGTIPYMFADVEAPSSNRVIQRVQYQQKAMAAAVQDILYVPFGAQGYQLKRLMVRNTNLSSLKLRRDGVDIYEDLPVALANARELDFGRNPQPAAPLANGALAQSAGGALAATTYYVRTTWVMADGMESTPAPETNFAVAINNVLNVAAPAGWPIGAIGWNVYVSSATGTETRQNGNSPLTLGTAWVEPTTGLVAGIALPAGFHVVDFMPDTLLSNALNTAFVQTGVDAKGQPTTTPVQNLDVRPTTSAADTLSIYTEAFSLNSAL
jgi:hypothetical protein